MSRVRFTLASALIGATLLVSTAALGADEVKLEVVLKDHAFAPSDFTVPAGKVVLLTVKNQDATPEEFDSHDLRVEKVIAGNSQAVVRIGPLDPGQYYYMGEYNEATAFGHVTVE